MERKLIKEFYGNLLDGKVPQSKWDEIENEFNSWSTANPHINLGITDDEVRTAIASMDLNKSCGDDFVFPSSLKNEEVKEKVVQCVKRTLNAPATTIPTFWRKTRLVLLSKSETEFA